MLAVTHLTSPMIFFLRLSTTKFISGLYLSHIASPQKTPFSVEYLRRSAAVLALYEIGFSTKTGFPASIHFLASSTWLEFTVAI